MDYQASLQPRIDVESIDVMNRTIGQLRCRNLLLAFASLFGCCNVVAYLFLFQLNFVRLSVCSSLFVISEFLLSDLSLLGCLFGRMAYMRVSLKLVNE